MTDKDYLQIAKGRMASSLSWDSPDEIRNRASIQAQAAALIAIAERLSDLIEIARGIDDVLCEMQGHG